MSERGANTDTSLEAFSTMAQARAASLRPLFAALKVKTETVDVLDVPLPNLHIDLVPSSYTPQALQSKEVERAARSLEIISIVASAYAEHGRPIPTKKIVPYAAGICSWIRYLTLLPALTGLGPKRGPTSDRLAIRNLKVLVVLGTRPAPDTEPYALRAAIVTSPGFVSLIPLLWMSRESDGDFVMWLSPTMSICPLVVSMDNMLLEEDGEQTLRDWFATSKFSLADIAGSVITRIHRVRANKGLIQGGHLAHYTQQLLHVAQFLVVNIRGVLDRLLKARFIRHCVWALEEHSRDACLIGKPDISDLSTLVRSIGYLVRIAEESGEPGWRQLASGTLLTLFVRILESPPDGAADAVAHRQAACHLFARASPHYATAVHLEDLPNWDRDREIQILTHMDDDLMRAWSVVGLMQHRFRNDIQPCMSACDNPSCIPTSPPPTTTSTKSKMCSACSFFKYCSQECQKKDWNERHRMECSQARVAESLLSWRHSNRLQWTARVLWEHQSLLMTKAAEGLSSRKYPTLSLHDTTAIVISPAAGSPKIEWDFTVVSRETWHNALMKYAAAEYLNPRIDALHQQFAPSGRCRSSRTVALVGAIINLGTDSSALMTMKLGFEGEDLLVQSVFTVIKHGPRFIIDNHEEFRPEPRSSWNR